MEKKITEVLPQLLMPENLQETRQLPTSTQTDHSDKIILAALASKKLFDCTPLELIDIITISVARAFADTGKRNDVNLNEQLEYIVQSLPGSLKRLFPSMRINEIPIAINRGIYKEFGEYYGINVAELVRFCRSYYESEQRIATIKTTLKSTNEIKLPPSKESIFNLYKNNLIEAFNKNLAGNNIEVNAPALYDFCDKLQLILFSTKEKYDIMQEAAIALIKDQHIILFVTVEDYKRKPYKRIIEVLTESLQENKPVPGDVKNMLIAKSKYLTLKAFLNDIHINELSLSNMVDNKKDLFINEA